MRPQFSRSRVTGRRRAQGESLKREIKQQIIERDECRCRLCHRRRDLQVHHIDGRGEWRAGSNHEPTNLITLCRRCHRLVHKEHIELNLTVLLKADARRIEKHVNSAWTSTVAGHLMQPERSLGLFDP